MNYYENILQKIENAIKNDDFKSAKQWIEDELKAPYIPNDIYQKLIDYQKELPLDNKQYILSDEEIENYLFSNDEKQLIAVCVLNKKNLRDYYDICNKYLKSNGNLNAKVLLIQSLISQEISDEYEYNQNGISYTFIPRYILLPEESFGFKQANELLKEHYLKEPSKYELAKSLLYKKCILYLPLSYEKEEANMIFKEIVSYIDKAFEC